MSLTYLHMIMLVRYFVIILLVYVAYKFITRFVLPVIRVSSQVKQQMRTFQEQMHQQDPVHDHSDPSPNGSTTRSSTEKAGEYIDFEEVR